MSETLDDLYFDWLLNLVDRQAENVDYVRLMKQLFNTEFIPMPQAPSDENRCSDGIALRTEFLRHNRSLQPTRQWLNIGCSVLEMLIGITRHITFEMDGDIGEWFWHLIDNLGLTKFTNGRWNGRAVDQIIERLVWRQYNYDGNGGLFPLKTPHEDQRHVELWFQMESYMLEMI